MEARYGLKRQLEVEASNPAVRDDLQVAFANGSNPFIHRD
jgi:hypothetical protein